jgi:hypothetical protein
MIVLVIAQVVVAIFIFMYKEETKTATIKAFDKIFDNRDNEVNMNVVDTVQANVSRYSL